MKRIVADQDRKERQENIVIKGARIEGEDMAGWAKEFLKEKVGVEVEIQNARKSGNVVILKLGSMAQKNEVMKNKSKLVGSRIFIENDLPLEVRKEQEEIQRWVKEKKELGMDVRTGRGKVAYNGYWWGLGEIESLEKKINEQIETQRNRKEQEQTEIAGDKEEAKAVEKNF